MQYFLKKDLFDFIRINNHSILYQKNISFKINNSKKYFLKSIFNYFNINTILEKLLVKKFNGNLTFKAIVKKSKQINLFLDDFNFLENFLSNRQIKNKIILLNKKKEILNLDLNIPFYFEKNKIQLKLFFINSYNKEKNIVNGFFLDDFYIYNNKSYYQNIIEIINFISIKNFKTFNFDKNISLHLKTYNKKNISSILIIKFFFSKLFRKFLFLQKLEQFRYKGKWKVFLYKDKNNFNQIDDTSNNYLADPFLISSNQKKYLFCEDFNYNENIGKISSFQIYKNGLRKYANVLKNKKHLSFPFIFKYKKKILMCPESGSYNDIRIYESTNFPNRWKFKKTIIKGINAADNIIFYKKKYWWLITSINLNTNSNFQNYIMIFYSKNIFSKNWIEHSMNPIFCEKENARNAGFLVDKKHIFRISQNIKNNFYGSYIKINKILRLNKDNYKEKKFTKFDTDLKFLKRNNLIGIHHLNMSNGTFVFDAYRKNKL